MAAEKPTHLDDIGLPDTHYNPLQNYRNVTYNTRLTMMPAIESTQTRTERSYDSSKGIIMWETGGAGTIFLEELTIETVGTGNNTGAYAMQQFHKFQGKLVEPVGGRFIEALSIGALTLGYPNNSDAVYMLEVSFQGYNTDSDQPEQCKGWDDEELVFRWYVKLLQLQMNLDYKGSIYDFEMFPDLGTAALSDHMNLEQGFKMEGSPPTISDFCKQLEEALNKREEAKIKSGERCYPHKYVISAHKEIAGLKYDYGLVGNFVANWSMLRGQLQVPAGTTIQSFILNSMPNSKEVLKFLHRIPEKKEFNSTETNDNTSHIPAKNFSIICGAKTQEKNKLPLFDNRIGTTAKEVHYFITTKEDAKNIISSKEYEDAWDPAQRDKRVDNWIKKGLLRKVYKWIYTGENSEVINADIKIDNLWRTVRPLWLDEKGNPISATSTQPASRANNSANKSKSVPCNEARMVQPIGDGKEQLYVEDMPYREGQDMDINPKKGWYPHMPQFAHVNTTVQEGSQQGALSKESAQEYSIYRQVGNNQATGGSDMFTVNLEVVGDPYWLFQIPSTPGSPPWEEDVWEYEKEQLTEEQMAEKRKKTASHNWLPFIYFEAISPAADWTSEDLMNLRKSDAITGIYSAKKVVNKFVKGKFTTSLECFRDQLSNPWGKKATNEKDSPIKKGEASGTGPNNAGASPAQPPATARSTTNSASPSTSANNQPTVPTGPNGEYTREEATREANRLNRIQQERLASGATTTVIGQVPRP
jgi:hypothetical protein